MKRITLLVAVITLAGMVTINAPASWYVDEQASPICGVKIPDGYRDWNVISMGHLAGGNVKQLRAQLGNDIAVKAFREGTLPFPDGTIIAALH